MEILVILSLLIGLACIFVELLMPGFGIFGIVGIILIILSWAITIFTFKLGIVIVLIEIVFITVGLYLSIKKLKRMQIYGRVILNDVLQNDKKQVGNMEEFIGREGVCKTDLRPFGSGEFNGIVLDILSDDGYIKKNSLIKIIRFEDNKLYVKLLNSN
ncbi:NfeD family protein [uncultured Tyzzerella sp.]|uniref:NfeD family protein n=1 Tax=uncultured Tyzzerella sp. TaxID=2321398 RepID=UPI002942E38E|nr:NfeD family protein [uncultured Tyzzerella sp.]